ncbi:MAG: hypothetical protein HY532_07735 [Chloroflexi bacterium]|nr:hypothetical protein [Chloroflexota bacterium]
MHSNGHRPAPAVAVSEFTEDIVGRQAITGPRYRRAMVILGGLFVLGVIGFIVRAVTDGFDDRLPWGYLAATAGYLLTTACAAPLAIIGLRAIKAHWRRPLARLAELYSLGTVVVLAIFVPLMFLIPSAVDRRTMYFQSSGTSGLPGTLGRIPGAPQAYDLALLIALVVAAIGLVWASTRPDRVLLGNRRGVHRGRWWGSIKQWRVTTVGIGLIGAIYFVTLIGFNSMYSLDFAMALVPGWKDAIFPAFQGITALQGGLATVIVSMYVLRRFGKMERYIHMEHFWAASKPLLAFCLLWFYFGWSTFIILWYGRMPVEQNVMQLLYFGPYSVFFYGAFLLCFVAPFLTLLWNSVRKSCLGPTVAATFILIGNLSDKIRLYAGSWSVPNEVITDHALEVVPAARYPDAFDIMMMAGGIAGAIFIVLWMARRVSIISIWEMSEGLRLRVVRPFLRTHVSVLGKPE